MTFSTTLRPIVLGQCIYCQEQSDFLTEEHVVPAGLGGLRTIPAASCEKCRKITQEFETTALRHVLGPGRYWLGVPARKKQKRPESWTAYRRVDGGPDQKIMIQMSELPFFLCMPTFAKNDSLKEIVTSGHVPSGADSGVIISEDPINITKKLSEYGASYLSPKIDHLSFSRMLAKIALGYCIIEFGWDKFTSAVSPLILGETNAYRNFVSSSMTPDKEGASGVLERRYEHHFSHQISNLTGMVCVRIELFKNFDTPSYYVLAGAIGGVTLRFSATKST